MAKYSFTISNAAGQGRIYPTEWFDVNNKGERVGTCWGMYPIAAIYYKGSGDLISAFSLGGETNSHGINNEGMIVGRSVLAHPWPGTIRGFFLPSINQIELTTYIPGPNGTYGTEIFAVNQNQVMVGLHGYPPPGGGLTIIQMFSYHAGNYTLLGKPSTEYSHPYGINDNGDIVGGRTQNGFRHAFIYKNGQFTELVFPGADDTAAYDINNHGHIVGWYQKRKEHGQHGFVFADGEFNTVDFPDASSTKIHGINDSGMIVGSFISKGFLSGFVATPTTLIVEPRVELLNIEEMKHLEL